MDSISTVRDAFNKVTKRQKLYHSVSEVVIDRVCEGILETLIRMQLDNHGVVETEEAYTDFRLNFDSLLPMIQLQGSQKEMHTSLTKYEKVLEKSYNPDISRACRNIDFDVHLVNKILIEYFYRQGLFEVGDCLVKEAEVEVESKARSQFLEIYQIVESMKVKNIEPAMRWISENREKLEENSSMLEMKLLSLKYCEKLREGNQSAAFEYAKTHFPHYDFLHTRVIQKLIAALLWINEPEKSPYVELVSPSNWENVTKELTKQYYNLLDQPSKSSLEVVLSAGFESLPTLLKLVHVMGLKKQEWELVKELPVPLEVGNEFQFHSVFVCPVSRDQSSKENPPMMLPCRHVVCKESIMKLGKNCGTRIFKCPFCLAQTSASACRELYL